MQVFGGLVFEHLVVKLRVHANLFHSPIAPCPLTKLNADDGRIVAVFPVFSVNALLQLGGGWTIRWFVPQWAKQSTQSIGEERDAGTDAGMAAALPQADRQCRTAAWEARDRV